MARAWVLLHGFAGGPAMWDEVAGTLCAQGRVLAPALMGHAGAPASGTDFVSEVQRIAALIADWRRPDEDLQLVGYSLGGRVALGLLATQALPFASASLIGAHPGLATDSPERASRAAADEAWAHLIETEGLAEFDARWQAQALFATQARLAPQRLAAQRAQRLAHEPAALAHAMRVLSLAAMPDWRGALPQVSLPTRLLVGAQDAKFLALATDLAAQWPAARVESVAGCGHNLVLEAPDAVGAALLAGPA